MAAAKPHSSVLPARHPALTKADSQQHGVVQPRAEHVLGVAKRTQDHITTDTESIGQVFDYANQEDPQDTLWRQTSFLCKDNNRRSEDRHQCLKRTAE